MTPLKPTYIFDLDHTVIDSSHRKLTRPDGSLDLEHWFANATREKIFADTLLPLAGFWRRIFRSHNVVIATARTMGQADWDFLRHHGLHFDDALFRHQGCSKPDHELKKGYVGEWLDANAVDPQNAIMYDDNDAVRLHVGQLGVIVRHPDTYNLRF